MPDHLEVVCAKVRPQRLPRDISELVYAITYFPEKKHESDLTDHLLDGFDYIRTKHPDGDVVIFGDMSNDRKTQFIGRYQCLSNQKAEFFDRLCFSKSYVFR